MEIRQLETFCTIVRLGSFSRAADDLYITQPAVSMHIKELEKELGISLLERGGRTIRLTQPGEMLHRYALRILRLAEEAKYAISEAALGEQGRVVVGAGATTTIFTLPPILQSLRTQHRKIEVIIQSGTSKQVAEMVRTGEVDLGLVTSPVGEEDLIVEPLLDDDVVAIVSSDHRLAGRKQVALTEFAHEPLILFVRGTGFRAHLDAIFASGGVTPQVQMELDNVEAIKALVEIGVGASLVPGVSVRSQAQQAQLAVVEIVDLPHLSRRLSLIHRKDKYLTPAIERFLEAIRTIKTI